MMNPAALVFWMYYRLHLQNSVFDPPGAVSRQEAGLETHWRPFAQSFLR